jgi:hypothetical protein
MQEEIEVKKTPVMILGVIQICLAVFFALIALAGIFSLNSEIHEQTPIMLSVLFYGSLSLLFLILGIGTLRIRKWARALTVIVSSIWLAGGSVLTLFYSLLLLTTRWSTLPGRGQDTTFVLVSLAILFLFFIFFPSLFLWANTRTRVAQLFQSLDRQPVWTDRFPLPVLLLLFSNGLIILFILIMLFSNIPFPFFGFFLFHTPSQIAWIGALILSILAFSKIFQLEKSGWYFHFILFVLSFLSGIITFFVRGKIALKKFFDMPHPTASSDSVAMLILIFLFLVTFLYGIFLHRTKRYF